MYRRTRMRKCDFNKVALTDFNKITLWHGCSPVNLLHIFRAPFPKNTSEALLLKEFRVVCVIAMMIPKFQNKAVLCAS